MVNELVERTVSTALAEVTVQNKGDLVQCYRATRNEKKVNRKCGGHKDEIRHVTI